MKTLPRVTPLLAAAVLTAAVAAPVRAQDKDAPAQTQLHATLSGSAEVAGGDTDGTGTFTATIDKAQGQLCYELSVSDIATASAAHIHRGAEGKNGGPVVSLEAPADGSAKACTDVDADVLSELAADPAGFYVNVHNADFKAGALRGQLMAGGGM